MQQSWQEALRELLVHIHDGNTRLAVLGIGHVLRRDDSVGIVIVRELAEKHVCNDRSADEQLCIIEAQYAPENFTGVLRRFKPTFVLMIDSANMGELPGTIRWLSWQDIGGMTTSTHTLSLSLLANYLRLELHCDIALLGIQPDCDTLGSTLSPIVQQSANHINELFLRKLD